MFEDTGTFFILEVEVCTFHAEHFHDQNEIDRYIFPEKDWEEVAGDRTVRMGTVGYIFSEDIVGYIVQPVGQNADFWDEEAQCLGELELIQDHLLKDIQSLEKDEKHLILVQMHTSGSGDEYESWYECRGPISPGLHLLKKNRLFQDKTNSALEWDVKQFELEDRYRRY